MSNTATTKERLKLTELLRGSGTEVKVPEFMGVIIHEGRVVISDYSKNDDRTSVLAILGAVGIEPKVQTESWCG